MAGEFKGGTKDYTPEEMEILNSKHGGTKHNILRASRNDSLGGNVEDAMAGKSGEESKKIAEIQSEIDKRGTKLDKPTADAMRKEIVDTNNTIQDKNGWFGYKGGGKLKDTPQLSASTMNASIDNIQTPQFDESMSLDDIVNKGAGDVDYQRKLKSIIEANDLTKFQKEDGSLDFAKLQKNTRGMKTIRGILNALGSGLSAAGGSKYEQNTGLAGLLNDKIDRQDEAVGEYKNAAQAQTEDQRSTASKANDTLIADWKSAKDANRQVEILKQSMKLSKAQAIELQKAMNELSLDQQVKVFNLMADRDIGDAIKYALSANPMGTLNSLSNALGGAAGALANFGIIPSDEQIKRYKSRIFK